MYRDYKSVGEDVWLCEGHSPVRNQFVMIVHNETYFSSVTSLLTLAS